jgi:mono/diheme cytochrome c family protein
MGPDLTNVISTPGKGMAYAKSFIQYGTQRMPNFGLDTTEVNELAAYLKQVDATGCSPVLNFEIQNNGTVIQKKLK